MKGDAAMYGQQNEDRARHSDPAAQARERRRKRLGGHGLAAFAVMAIIAAAGYGLLFAAFDFLVTG